MSRLHMPYTHFFFRFKSIKGSVSHFSGLFSKPLNNLELLENRKEAIHELLFQDLITECDILCLSLPYTVMHYYDL